MHRSTKIGFALLAVILSASLSGCSTVKMENDYSNIGNMYIAALEGQDGENVYVVDPDSNVLYKSDKVDSKTEDIVTLGSGVEKVFLPSNGLIYYVNSDDNGSIYSMDKNGENKTKISSMTCEELVTYQDTIYFTDSEGLYTMEYDGSNLQEILKGTISNLYPYQSSLFFLETFPDVPYKDIIADQHIIYRYNLEDNEITQIGGMFIRRFFVLNDLIYYLDDYDLCSMNLEGSEVSQITKSSFIPENTMNIYGKYIIFSNYSDSYGTYALDTQTGKMKRISKELYNYIFMLNDVLMTDQGPVPLTIN